MSWQRTQTSSSGALDTWPLLAVSVETEGWEVEARAELFVHSPLEGWSGIWLLLLPLEVTVLAT